ncbi:MAG: hypothetical protein WAK31_30705 [Chthoniobacterales bacterium]
MICFVHQITVPINKCGPAKNETVFAAALLHASNLLFKLFRKPKVIGVQRPF